MVDSVQKKQEKHQAVVVQQAPEGSWKGRAIVDLTEANSYDFKAGAGPLKFGMLASLTLISTMVATVTVGITTMSFKSAGVTFAVGAVATLVFDAYGL